mgnify:CR=1 FL=1
MQKRCILCADPDPELRSNLGFLLAGENCVLEETAGGATLLTQLRRNTDLVILPQQLPDMSGFDACTALRRQSAAPVLFLLEKADESAKTLSFSVGGDDCLEKPVSCHELAVRVKALLRRYCVYGARPAGLERRLRCGGLTGLYTRRGRSARICRWLCALGRSRGRGRNDARRERRGRLRALGRHGVLYVAACKPHGDRGDDDEHQHKCDEYVDSVLVHTNLLRSAAVRQVIQMIIYHHRRKIQCYVS